MANTSNNMYGIDTEIGLVTIRPISRDGIDYRFCICVVDKIYTLPDNDRVPMVWPTAEEAALMFSSSQTGIHDLDVLAQQISPPPDINSWTVLTASDSS